MAESTQVALAAAPIPSSADIARAEKFVRERFLHEGEDAAVVLAPGCARRRALDAALVELEQQAKYPSTAWRREFSLLLGLERVLSEEEPRLRDGTLLSAHQVDALSGTLTALLAEAERSAGNGNGNGRAAAAAMASPELLASASILGPDGDTPPPANRARTDCRRARRRARAPDEDAETTGSAPKDDLDDLDDEDDEEDEDDEGPGVAPAAAEDEDDEGEDLGDIEDELEPLPGEDEEEDAETEAESEEAAGLGDEEDEEEALPDQPEDPNAAKRFWFEHATGAGKTVAALGFVEASQTGRHPDPDAPAQPGRPVPGRAAPARLLQAHQPPAVRGGGLHEGPGSVETYQWFVRNAGRISSAYTIVICDEAHTALGEKTSGAIREWTGPIFIGMTATGALIARHVTDLFPTQTSRFDLAQAARRGVISPLRCVRISPGAGVRTIAKVPLRRGEVDTEFDQEQLAELLDQQPFNLAMANLYKTRFNGVPGVVYAAGVRHAYNLAEAFRAEGLKAQAVSGETPKRELATVLARYERGDIDVLINAQLLAEGWNSPRATVCVHLAPTASKRIYQQRVGRVTRRHPGKEAGLVVDFVHPATKHDDPVVTLHSLLDRDVYRGGAIVVGPVRRGRGRRMRVERRVLPVCSEEERRFEVFERELWRIAVEHLDYGEQHVWAALAGARVTPNGWRRARAMLHFDRDRRAQESLPDDRGTAQPERAAAPAGARGHRGGPRRGRLRHGDRRDRGLAPRGAPGGFEDHAARARRAAHRPPRPGERVDLAAGGVHARATRGVRGAALARDQAPAGPAGELLGRRARAQRAPADPRLAQAGPPSGGGAAGGRARAHARRPRRRCAARARAWRASRRRWRGSCCATSPNAVRAPTSAGARGRRPARGAPTLPFSRRSKPRASNGPTRSGPPSSGPPSRGPLSSGPPSSGPPRSRHEARSASPQTPEHHRRTRGPCRAARRLERAARGSARRTPAGRAGGRRARRPGTRGPSQAAAARRAGGEQARAEEPASSSQAAKADVRKPARKPKAGDGWGGG